MLLEVKQCVFDGSLKIFLEEFVGLLNVSKPLLLNF